MNRIILIIILSAFFKYNFIEAQTPTEAQTMLKYNSAVNKYQVCIKFNQNGPVSIGSSLISICFPENYPDNKISVTSLNGGNWGDNSRTFNENGKDYHAFTTIGEVNMGYTLAGTELILFEFALPEGCIPEVRLWDSKLGDKEQTSDGTDYISNIFTPYNNNYILTSTYGSLPNCCQVKPCARVAISKL